MLQGAVGRGERSQVSLRRDMVIASGFAVAWESRGRGRWAAKPWGASHFAQDWSRAKTVTTQRSEGFLHMFPRSCPYFFLTFILFIHLRVGISQQ